MISGIPDSTDPPWPADPNWSEGLEIPPPADAEPCPACETKPHSICSAHAPAATAREWTVAYLAENFRLDDVLIFQKLRDAHNAALKAQQQDTHLLGELLAVIHGDGGHYQSDHGSEKATKDAIDKIYAMKSQEGK